MGRELKRVPLDFEWPIGEIWEGFCPSIEKFQKLFGDKFPVLYEYNHAREICGKCEDNFGACSESADYCFWHNPKNKKKWHKEIPVGKGYQLWENTTEGSPMSPVFETLEQLCEYLADNQVSWFAGMTMSKEEWYKTLVEKDYILPVFEMRE